MFGMMSGRSGGGLGYNLATYDTARFGRLCVATAGNGWRGPSTDGGPSARWSAGSFGACDPPGETRDGPA
jgi:hypothetical protein